MDEPTPDIEPGLAALITITADAEVIRGPATDGPADAADDEEDR